MAYTGPMNNSEIEHAHLHPEPCAISYGRIISIPQAGNSHGPLPSGITYMAAPPPARLVPVPTGHGLHNQLAFPNHQVINGFHGAFKGKTAEGFPVNFQYFCPAPGLNSFVVPDDNVIPVVMGPARHRAAGATDHNPDLQFMPMSHGGQSLQVVPGPWLDNAPGIPFMLGCTNGYQVMTANRNPVAFVHPPVGPHSPPLMPPLHPPVPRFMGHAHAPPVGIRVYHPHREELTFASTSRHRGFSHLRVLPEDGTPMLDISSYGRRIDHHRDMRLDIDHMSYEELLDLGEQIGNADSGLSEDFILGHLKTKTFTSLSKSSSHPEDVSSADQGHTLCTICQMEYDDQDNIGMLDCSHVYHADCIHKWLIVKNSCPVCKNTALTAQGKDSGNLENS